ncbi:LacI family DNA-binding transcriptional regulator [Herbiconiux sp. P15]|uniref:LacI family DNA-binding transcriptional regulator n=1 Tax=Herbiconiux liukaitaii TaxID=3342799 RepID=UPI0035BA3766
MVASSASAVGVTLRDIAREAGISVSAVSMALRDHPRIGPETKSRVTTIADQLGYVPNSAGRALRAQKADAIALIVPNTSQHVFGHAYFMHVLTGVTAVANNSDAQVMISTNPDESHGMAAYERVMRSGRVDGAIVTSAAVTDDNIERLVLSGLPLVLLGNFPYLPDSISIGVDDRAAAFEATSHLIQVHGRRALVHVSGPLDHQSAIDRRDGFVAAVEAHGATGQVLDGDYSESRGASAVEHVEGIDGVFAANDESAFGAMTRLRERGFGVPTNISIIGFDDFGLSRVTTPSISTMHVPAERMARLATERLFDLVSGESVGQGDAHVTLPVELVARESCGC